MKILSFDDCIDKQMVKFLGSWI